MKLFEPYKLGKITLQNRVVMAPLTRSRAIGNIPNEVAIEYYAQRASAGLIITEGTSPSPNGVGYARIPGIYSTEQARAWKKITDAVHAKGGHIFLQMMHTGRVTHAANLPSGARVVAPSAITAKGQMWTDTNGLQDLPQPTALTTAEVESTIQEFIDGARRAVNDAGFDGVELHGANGYLIEQFLNPNTNQRGDIYGKDRMEFAVRLAQGVAQVIGADKVGIRLSPYGTFNDMGSFEGVDAFYAQLAQRLSQIGIAYVHVIDHGQGEVKRLIRENFKGAYILAQNYDVKRAEQDLLENKGDLVAFGRAFISNPDLVERMKQGVPLTEADSSTFYTAGPKGYTDYKTAT